MCRQQCGCFGPHQAALGVSSAHVPTQPVNQPSQASGSTAATKPLRPDPQKQTGQRQTDAVEAAVPRYAYNSLHLCYMRWKGLKSYNSFPFTRFFVSYFYVHFFHVCVGVLQNTRVMPTRAQLPIDQRGMQFPPHLAPPQLICCSAP